MFILIGHAIYSRIHYAMIFRKENILLKANAASYVDVNDIHSKLSKHIVISEESYFYL